MFIRYFALAGPSILFARIFSRLRHSRLTALPDFAEILKNRVPKTVYQKRMNTDLM